MATLLQICQDVCATINLPVPSAVMLSTDATAVKLRALAQEELRQLASRGLWAELTVEATFSTVAGTAAYPLSGIAADIDRIVPGTLWNRSLREQVSGPIDGPDWQQQKASQTLSPWKQFRLLGRSIYLYPTPEEVNVYAFEYVSKYRCESSGGAGQERWTADADVPRLDDSLITLGLRWRMLRSAGMPYAEEMAEYDAEVEKRIVRTKVAGTISSGGSRRTIGGAVIPEGNWSLS